MLTWMPAKWVAIASLGLATGAIGWHNLALTRLDGPPPAARPGIDPAAPDDVARTTSPVAAPGVARPPADAPRESGKVSLPDYVVEPPDILVVEVQGDLDGRPIRGQRLVRPDGKVSLGFYGEVYVAGLTTVEIKEKIANHLRQFLTDDQLGLVATPAPNGRVRQADLAAARRIFVDVASSNSKVYYVQGDVRNPGRLPVTGNETVLDALVYAGGLTFQDVDPVRAVIQVVRPAAPGAGGERTLPVDLKAILRGEVATNYQLGSQDRVIVRRNPAFSDAEVAANRLQDQVKRQGDRLDQLEQKLDRILQKLDALEKR